MANRIIKDSILTSETVGGLDDLTWRVFVSLIVLADDFGRGKANPAIIRGQAFPLREDVTAEQIRESLNRLSAAGAIVLYQSGDTVYFWLPTWNSHQRIRNSIPKTPNPANCEVLPQLAANCRNSPQLAADCGELPRNTIQENPKRIQEESKENPTTTAPAPAAPVDEIVALFNGICRSFSPVSSVEKWRIEKVGALWQTCPDLDTFREVFEIFEASDFLKGGGEKGWKASFDWLMKPDNFRKVMEHQYDERPKAPAKKDTVDEAFWEEIFAEARKEDEDAKRRSGEAG